MGLLTRALAIPERRHQDVVVSSTSPFKNWLGQIVDVVAGKPVTVDKAMSIVAVHAANRVLAEGVSSLPLHIYKRLPRGREKDPDFYLYELLHDQPNPEQTAVEFIETLQGHLPLWGNAYAEIQRDAGMRPIALWPLRPDRMTVSRRTRNAELEYTYHHDDGSASGLRKDQVFHLHGLGFNGLVGYSLVALHRRAFGLTVAAEEFGARFYESDASSGVVLQTPPGFSDTAKANLRASWTDRREGLSNAYRTAILEHGVTANVIGMNPKDSQHIELLGFQKGEVATMFRVPPVMIGDVDRSTSWGTGIEQQKQGFVTFSLLPWLRRWEQAIRRDLITKPYRTTHYAKFALDGFLRGDSITRWQTYHIARMDGIYNADDILELEDMNPLPDGKGQAYWIPAGVVPSDAPAAQVDALRSIATGLPASDPIRDLIALNDLASPNGHREPQESNR